MSLSEVLFSEGPRPEAARELAFFGRLVGSWHVAVTNHHEDGDEELTGEWHFGWVLDGRAVQDVWLAPTRAERARTGDRSGEWGATLRFYDERSRRIRSTWIGPGRGWVMPFVAREQGAEMVLEGVFDEVHTRWIFSDVERDTFRWRAAESADGGRTWRVRQSMIATRV
ncbi:hypothetical protein HII36_10160 [Nonomuraea sp. NN258]|uniref:hypothetical protein n=1 Tax=Nonomuraea antri TaxID=2730852 RepID=UPI00156A275C|nr:hypothetical protein [Nonomuraea antri]NRQ32196.1 hypothetical protein [Nonomuraea antri]